MKCLLKSLCLGTLMIVPLILNAGSQTRMLHDLESIQHAFQVSYAPADWKKTFCGWDLDVETEIARAGILSPQTKTTKDFQGIIKRLLNSTKDYHVSVLFASTEKATLPFFVKGAEGRYFFSFIDRNKLSLEAFPFSEGDELLHFDGSPVDEVVAELMKEETSSNEGTDQALAEIYLTRRSGKLGHVIPKGAVTIAVLRKGSTNPSNYQLIWNYSKERVAEPPKEALYQAAFCKSQKPLQPKKLKKRIKNGLFNKKLISPKIQTFLADDDDRAFGRIGSRKSFIPTLGSAWWKTPDDCPFHAYLFELPDQRIAGYVRIPSYSHEDISDVEEFASIITLFEAYSDVLVIDQVDNPGGSVFYLYALASMLTEQPLITPKHRMMITQSEVFAALDVIPIFEMIESDSDAQAMLGDSLEGIPMTYQLSQFCLNYFQFIVDEWSLGRVFTEPYYLYGVDNINPHPQTRYTKPILVLVNGLDFSGGDFFPAILQDNNRVTVMGARTAGAGGFISQFSFPNLNGIEGVQFTASIAERLDKSPIENLGVTPTVPYEITTDDLQYDYKDYQKAICETLMDLVPPGDSKVKLKTYRNYF